MSKEDIIKKLDEAGIPYNMELVEFIEECCEHAYTEGRLDGSSMGEVH